MTRAAPATARISGCSIADGSKSKQLVVLCSLLVVPGFLVLYERCLIGKNPIAIVAESDRLFLSLFLLPDHAVAT